MEFILHDEDIWNLAGKLASLSPVRKSLLRKDIIQLEIFNILKSHEDEILESYKLPSAPFTDLRHSIGIGYELFYTIRDEVIYTLFGLNRSYYHLINRGMGKSLDALRDIASGYLYNGLGHLFEKSKREYEELQEYPEGVIL